MAELIKVMKYVMGDLTAYDLWATDYDPEDRDCTFLDGPWMTDAVREYLDERSTDFEGWFLDEREDTWCTYDPAKAPAEVQVALMKYYMTKGDTK